MTRVGHLWYKYLVADFEPELNIGDWSNGMIGVSKTFGGGSIPSSPGVESTRNALFAVFLVLFVLCEKRKVSKRVSNKISYIIIHK